MEDFQGIYRNLENAEDYSHLNLMNDSTFFLTQSPKFSDIMISSYGKWNIIGNRICLTTSTSLDKNINYKEQKNIHSDTLIMKFGSSIKQKIGSFKVKIGLDTSIHTNPNELVINKKKYYEKFNSKLESEKDQFYKYYPAKIFLWNKDYNLEKWYIFSNSTIDISIEDLLSKIEETNKITFEYKIQDSIIYTNEINDRIIPHKLKKE